ncbi:MAG: glycosyltransferase family 4 protein [Sedimentisphaerales bacterium]|jgi:glycosyltransferase involved in cell wall biosynthesis
MTDLRVGILPYNPGLNPYQRLFAGALESAGVGVERIPNRKFMPISRALSGPIDLLHIEWHHLFYAAGRMPFLPWVRKQMYLAGLKKLRDFPLVWTAHNIVAHDTLNREFEIDMTQRLLDCCDGIMVMSKAAENALRQVYRVPAETIVKIIPHGHFIGVYPNQVSREQARGKLAIAKNARVILMLGRILRYKGTDLLIDAFSKIAKKNDVLLLAGPAPSTELAAEVKRLAEKSCPQGARIYFTGKFVPDNEVQFFFNAADVVALPFRNILNSGSLMLAMSFGCCVVAPRMGSIPEIACPDAYFGYDADEAEGLVSALREALAQPNLVERGQASKQFARNRYSWGDIGLKARELYEEVLGRIDRR